MCAIDGCSKQIKSSGMCSMHCMRMSRYGDVSIVKQLKGLPLSERLSRHSVVSDGCWGWSGKVNSSGYGIVFFGGRWVGAHRAAWVLANGEIPAELHVLHTCDNRKCTNPDHLFLGTNADNVADKVSKGRQHRVNPYICTVNGCESHARSRGMCKHHYNRVRHEERKRGA
jgi:hypothetical protein